MNLVAGLGNPGSRYEASRHNVGFMAVARAAERAGISLKKKGYQGIYGVGRMAGCEVMLLQPHTFMNLSGASVASAARSQNVDPEDVIVLHDDLDLPFGALRVKVGGGHGGQKGVQNILSTLDSADFIRLRIGIGRPPAGGDVSSYVLSRFSGAEQKCLEDILEGAVDALEVILANGAQKAMNQFNNRDFILSV